jgi:hypothetical protein
VFDCGGALRTVTVTVIRPFDHEGRAVSPGGAITVAPIVAATLARQGLVSLMEGATLTYLTRDMAPADQDAPSPSARSKRRYRRRDLTAESS